MKLPTILMLSSLCFLSFNCTLNGQEAVVASGANAEGATGSVCYSIGQTFYQFRQSANGSVAEGVQQPYEISVVTGGAAYPGIQLRCSIRPNPVINILILSIEEDSPAEYSAWLADMNGKLLRKITIQSNETQISMSEYQPATYYLTVNKVPQSGGKALALPETETLVKTFKIVKI